jgi:hypothetical protein
MINQEYATLGSRFIRPQILFNVDDIVNDDLPDCREQMRRSHSGQIQMVVSIRKSTVRD